MQLNGLCRNNETNDSWKGGREQYYFLLVFLIIIFKGAFANCPLVSCPLVSCAETSGHLGAVVTIICWRTIILQNIDLFVVRRVLLSSRKLREITIDVDDSLVLGQNNGKICVEPLILHSFLYFFAFILLSSSTIKLSSFLNFFNSFMLVIFF